ncbi:MAG TPA: DCC1-like thiol-disulfide oxidoreductase family protein [Longimicrobiales bacterium]|nr:DCC1-like thiol-disulfide oxidoreductase family protein [Longimicrobiales bacterium]
MKDAPRGPSPASARGADSADPERRPPILLYDGLCGFCDGTVRFVLRHDPGGPMRFAPLQGQTAAAIVGRHPGLEGVDSLVLVETTSTGETVSVRSQAVIRLAAYVGGVWGLACMLRPIPRSIRDRGYAFFARHRHRLFGRYDVCPVPPAEVRGRFLP